MNGFQDIHLCTLYQGANEGIRQENERQTKKGKNRKSHRESKTEREIWNYQVANEGMLQKKWEANEERKRSEIQQAENLKQKEKYGIFRKVVRKTARLGFKGH